MAQTVEIRLKIPSLRVRSELTGAMETVNKGNVRFRKHIELEIIPKPGDVLQMSVSSGETFECAVVRTEWHQDQNMFVIACQYAKRSISPAEYKALMVSSDWQVRPLL
jgi:hypothetical protein